MSSEFTKGQPVRARRSEADKFQDAWYLDKLCPSGHLVHIDGAGPAQIPEDMLQPRPNDIMLTGQAYVFKRRAGGYTLISMDGRDKDSIIETYKNFAGWQLVGLIDLAKFAVAFPEGEGLLPPRHTN